MATIDKTGCGPLLGAIPADGPNKVYVMSNVVDLSGAVTPDDLTIYNVLAIPANTLVMHVALEVITPATGTQCAFSTGDGSGLTSWDVTADMKGVAGTITHSVIGTDTYGSAANQGKFYSAADSIDVQVVAATTDQDGVGPKFRLSALCVQF